jgi:hypothetical protein
MSKIKDLKAYQVTGLTMRMEYKHLVIWINKMTTLALKNDLFSILYDKKFHTQDK